MARGVKFSGANGSLGAPTGDEDRVCSLPVFRNGTCVVSCWEFSEEEIQEIIKTKCIYLSLLSGITMSPAIVLASKKEMSVFLLDYGKTFKEIE